MGNKTFILSHTGNIDTNKKLSEHSVEELTFIRADYKKINFEDDNLFSVSGHTPTLAINGEAKIYYCQSSINIDCGAGCGGNLACLRLDDMQEFYL